MVKNHLKILLFLLVFCLVGAGIFYLLNNQRIEQVQAALNSKKQNLTLIKKENGKEEITGQAKIIDQYKIFDISENEVLDEYSYLKPGFQDLSIFLEADQPIFSKENYRGSTSIVDIFWQG